MVPFLHIGTIIHHHDGYIYLIIPEPVVYRSESPFASWFTEWELQPGTYRVQAHDVS